MSLRAAKPEPAILVSSSQAGSSITQTRGPAAITAAQRVSSYTTQQQPSSILLQGPGNTDKKPALYTIADPASGVRRTVESGQSSSLTARELLKQGIEAHKGLRESRGNYGEGKGKALPCRSKCISFLVRASRLIHLVRLQGDLKTSSRLQDRQREILFPDNMEDKLIEVVGGRIAMGRTNAWGYSNNPQSQRCRIHSNAAVCRN